jgi:hypothetical protein
VVWVETGRGHSKGKHWSQQQLSSDEGNATVQGGKEHDHEGPWHACSLDGHTDGGDCCDGAGVHDADWSSSTERAGADALAPSAGHFRVQPAPHTS